MGWITWQSSGANAEDGTRRYGLHCRWTGWDSLRMPCRSPPASLLAAGGPHTTPAVRPFAETLVDRGVVYYPNPAPGNKPIGVGHCYSVLALLPERGPQEAPWVVPLRCERVPTAKKARGWR